MRHHLLCASLLAAACAASPCAADVTTDVYDLAVRMTRPAGPAAWYQLTIVSLAMFDAATAVERRYQPYLPQPVPPADATADAATLGAGCAALAALQPAQQADVAKACDAIAATPPSGGAAGRRFGEGTGAAMVAARRGDGFGAPNTYRPFTTAGTYVPTALPINYDVATMKPFALTSPSQLRPGPPPALTGPT